MAISPGGRPADDSPFSTSTDDNWVARAGGLPKYIREVAHALKRKGWSTSRAIATAVTRMKVWAAGGDNVSAKVQAAAAAALAEWEAKRGASHVTKSDIVKALREEVAPADQEIVKQMWSLITKEFKYGRVPVEDISSEHVSRAARAAAMQDTDAATDRSGYYSPDGDMDADDQKYILQNASDANLKVAWADLHRQHTNGYGDQRSKAIAHRAKLQIEKEQNRREKKSSIKKSGHHIPGTPFRYKHGWIPVAGDVHEVDHGPGKGVTQYHIIDVNKFQGGSAKVKVVRGSRSSGRFRKLDQVTTVHKLSTLGPHLDGHKFLGNKKKETPIPKKSRSSRGSSPSDGRQLVGHSFVGRARSTGAGGPKERQVRTPNGKVVWAEEGSLLWQKALGRQKVKKSAKLTKREMDEAWSLVNGSASGSSGVSKSKRPNDNLTMQGAISKVDNEKQRVFGWASVGIRKDGQVVIDKQGDLIDDPAEMENAAYNFVLHSRDGGEMHIRKGVSTLIESFVITPEKQKALGIPDGVLPKSAWWTGWQVHDPEVWKGIKTGKYKMFSVHGRGTRKRVD